jgi:hypothetical protein
MRADDGTYIGRQTSNVEFEASNQPGKEATNNSDCAAVWEILSFKKTRKEHNSFD